MKILFTDVAMCSITATDGKLGSVADILFDQKIWKARWFVAKARGWLGRKVLVTPSNILRAEPRAGGTEKPETVVINLTRSALKECPDASLDEPVSQQDAMNLYACPGSDPLWGGSGSFGEYSGDAAEGALGRRADQGDPNLRSCSAVIGYHICALDGMIGHVEDFVFDDRTWSIEFIVVDTKDWESGERVLLSPQAVTGIGWSDQQVLISISRDQVKASPPWEK